MHFVTFLHQYTVLYFDYGNLSGKLKLTYLWVFGEFDSFLVVFK